MKAHINASVEVESIDQAATQTTQVEVMAEVGGMGTFKLYVHEEGRTVIRICKLRPDQIKIEGWPVDVVRPNNQEAEAFQLLREIHASGELNDETQEEVARLLGIEEEPENPRETKGDLDFHNDREEGRI